MRVVWLTNGDFNEWSFLRFSHRPALTPGEVLAMGRRRQNEARLAAERLGLTPDQMTFLGYPDHGTLAIWRSHWEASSPYRALLTRATKVPYVAALRPGAEYTGQNILQDLEQVMRDFRPTVIAVSHPADHHPDHRALYLFTRLALWDLDLGSRVRLAPFLVHYPGWPPGHVPTFDTSMPPPASLQELAWSSLPLTAEEVANKEAALKEHRTQMASGRGFLRRFLRSNELFGDFDVVTLPAAPSGRDLSVAASGPPELPTEDLSPAARSPHALIIAHLRVGREGDELRVEIALRRPLRPGDAVMLGLTGWRPGRALRAPAQITYEVGPERFRATSHATPGRVGMALRRDGRQLTIRVRLAELGSPSRILLNVETRSDRLATHLLPIRVLSLPVSTSGD